MDGWLRNARRVLVPAGAAALVFADGTPGVGGTGRLSELVCWVPARLQVARDQCDGGDALPALLAPILWVLSIAVAESCAG